jgi:hypothetical protein
MDPLESETGTPRGVDPWGRSSEPSGPEFNPRQKLTLMLFTDSHVIRGFVDTRLKRLSDVLNQAEHDFLVVSNATMEEFGTKGQPTLHAEFAQVNLNTLLFAATDSIVEPQPEMRLVKSPEDALIVVPPFKIVGRIHVLPGRDLREALSELTGKFIPVTDASYWSDALGEPKVQASFVAFNHARAHVLASHEERDPWQGLKKP